MCLRRVTAGGIGLLGEFFYLRRVPAGANLIVKIIEQILKWTESVYEWTETLREWTITHHERTEIPREWTETHIEWTKPHTYKPNCHNS